MNNFMGRAGMHFSQKRPASFAGTWYESDPKKLRPQLLNYLTQAQEDLTKSPIEEGFASNFTPVEPILAIVAPHAGYMFSGQTAAFAYEQARKQKPKRVFLLGPSHYVGFEGAALPTETMFATPLGDLQVDKDVVDELADFPLFRHSSPVHRREHSLEMQLPFVRQTFGDVKIVPIIVGTLPDEMDVQLMAQILRRYLQAGDLVVVSSDFTHFGPRYEYEPFQTDLRENIRKLDAEAFEHLSKHDLKQFLQFKERTNDTICGFYPCAVLLAMLPDESLGSLLRYRTSQDALAEEDRNSVSYLALAFSCPNGITWSSDTESGGVANCASTDEETPKSSSDRKTEFSLNRKSPEFSSNRAVTLSSSDRQNLLKLARLTLESVVRWGRIPEDKELDFAKSEFTRKKMGAFVTLYKVNSGEVRKSAEFRKDLRGCIGYIWPVKPLYQTVVDNTIGSCSKDYRFQPVTESELPDLQIDINVLTAPCRVKSYNDIVVGRDGVVLYKEGRQSVFLPSVATEFGWDLNELLSQLSLKAGLPADAWKHGAKFDVFQSESVRE